MELSSQEVEIPMPINSVYGGVHAHGHGHSHAHMTHHHHHQHQHHYHHDDQEQVPSSATSHDHNNINPSSSSSPQRPTNIINNGNVALNLEDHDNDCNNNTNSIGRSNSTTTKKLIKFRECQKNHAASMGGNATDGCGEFMPSGEEGTLEALTCSACNCHRNFHRKEILGEHRQQYPPHAHRIYLSTPHHQPHRILSTGGRKVILGGGSPGASGGVGGQGYLGYPTGVGVGAGTLIPMSRALPINVPYQVGPSATPSDQSDDHDHDHDHDHHQMVRPPHQLVKKRFRTKFSQEQKEKMLAFAEKVGWNIQKQEENVVQQFCQEIGVKRRVLKVWMHNNKHTLAKKSNPNNIDNNNNINPSLL